MHALQHNATHCNALLRMCPFTCLLCVCVVSFVCVCRVCVVSFACVFVVLACRVYLCACDCLCIFCVYDCMLRWMGVGVGGPCVCACVCCVRVQVNTAYGKGSEGDAASTEVCQLRHTVPHCNTLQHTATRCNTMQHDHCNTLADTHHCGARHPPSFFFPFFLSLSPPPFLSLTLSHTLSLSHSLSLTLRS